MEWRDSLNSSEFNYAQFYHDENDKNVQFSLPPSDGTICPFLEIVIQPQSKFRFRYASEMTGKHGSLLGANTQQNSNSLIKSYPTVKLHNFSSNAFIRCSLVGDLPPYYPHPHILDTGQFLQNEPKNTPSTTHEINLYAEGVVGPENNFTLAFQGLNVIYTGKKNVKKELIRKIGCLEEGDSRKINEDEINELTMSTNLNVVSLYFEAFVKKETEQFIPICPPLISNPIHHNKSTQTSDLRIVRIDKYTSCCTGDEEVFILVEKVDKHNIQVKFYEENNITGTEVWKSYGKFSKLDVHHQYAIVFRTPPYRSKEIETEIDVWVQLERPSDSATSPPIPFKYIPIERLRKMPRSIKARTESEDRPNDPGPNFQNANLPPDSPSTSANFQNNSQNAQNVQNYGPSSSSSVRRATNLVNFSFPCDISNLEKCEDDEEKSSKFLALNAALGLGESLHSWAKDSDLSKLLLRLRHLLCLVDSEGNTSLHTAILHNQSEPFDKILESVTSLPDTKHLLNEPNLEGQTPTILAVILNRVNFLQKLVQKSADLSLANSEGDTPLHLAVKFNNLEAIKIIVASSRGNEVINRFNYKSLTPLHLAVLENSLEAVSILCSFNANLSCQEGTFGRTPLHISIESKNLVLSYVLLNSAGEKNELVNIQNYRGDTALHTAVSDENNFSFHLIALLLYFGADPSIRNHDLGENEERNDGFSVFELVKNEELKKLIFSRDREECWTILKTSPELSYYLKNSLVDKNIISEGGGVQVDSGIDIKDQSQSI